MEERLNRYNELKEIAPFLAELKKINVYSVPPNYFDQLPIDIQRKIKGDVFKSPSSGVPVLSVPGDYFENLAANILQKIKSLENEADEELKHISPLLYQLGSKNVFTVPEGYFERLSAYVIKLVTPQAKVVVMKKRSMLWNTAAAAMLTGVMAVSALWISNNSYQQTSIKAGNNSIFLNVKDALQYKSEQQINEGIANLSEEDIIIYLEVTGDNADDDVLASGIEVNELPDETDYLTNEKTLELFLENINTGKTQN